jgi:hypothetical protein
LVVQRRQRPSSPLGRWWWFRMSVVTRTQRAFSPRLLSRTERTLSLSLLIYTHMWSLLLFLKTSLFIFRSQKRVRVDQTPLPLFSLSLSLRLFTSLVESCLRDNNRDD